MCGEVGVGTTKRNVGCQLWWCVVLLQLEHPGRSIRGEATLQTVYGEPSIRSNPFLRPPPLPRPSSSFSSFVLFRRSLPSLTFSSFIPRRSPSFSALLLHSASSCFTPHPSSSLLIPPHPFSSILVLLFPSTYLQKRLNTALLPARAQNNGHRKISVNPNDFP